jgi:heat shock 70kDa protein 1/2/6/8
MLCAWATKASAPKFSLLSISCPFNSRERRAIPLLSRPSEMGLAIGLDLGTANTCTAVYRNGDVEVVLHDGHRSMPSFVAFTDTGRLIGAAARNQASVNPRNTVFGIMRLIGRKFSDPDVQAEINGLPFNIIDKGGKPVISVEYMGETRVLSPEEILSMILGRAKDDAEAHLGGSVQNALILVPAYFNTIQRESIKQAAQICGLNTLRLINAPTAAAIDHTLTNWSQDGRKILVVDLGAGTLDVVLVSAGGGVLEVHSTASDLRLGGVDFDNRILNHFVQEFKRKHKLDITANLRALRRLRTACEAAKHELSTRTETEIEVDTLYKGIDFKSTLTRTRFEELCQDLFHSIISLIERVLMGGRADKTLVSDIVAIGGSSRIPRIQHLLSHFLGGKPVLKSLNFDEAQARGAAMQAAILSGYPGARVGKLSEFLLSDVAPLSIGIETPGGLMATLIQRNTSIPTKSSKVFSTFSDNQEYFDVLVFEGERARTKENIFLGRFSLGPIPPAPRGVPQIQVTVDIDANSILNATAIDTGTRIKKALYIHPKECLSREELEHMMTETAKYKADEKVEAERVAAKNALEAYTYSCKEKIYDDESRKELDNMIEWLDTNECASAPEYLEQEVKLQVALAAIAKRHSQQTRNKSESQSIAGSGSDQIKAESAHQWRETMQRDDERRQREAFQQSQRDINSYSGHPPHPRVESTPESAPGSRDTEGPAFARSKDPPRQSDPP